MMINKHVYNNPGQLAKLLKMHNDWRRGIGKYKWNDNPLKNNDSPFTPCELTKIIQAAIRHLKSI